MAKQYQGMKTKEISFPLGGIGSGCVGLAGNGRLIDWEIFNRPNKGSVNGFSHFAVKAERGDRVLDARVLQGDALPPFTGVVGTTMFTGYGWGPVRETMAGVPHFQDVVFEGSYPFAKMAFTDPKFPGTAALTAWNPFIPLNPDDSSLPAAFFEIGITNTGSEPLVYTVAFSVGNPLTHGALRNTSEQVDSLHLLRLASDDPVAAHPRHGRLCVATDAVDSHAQAYWYRGRWFDSLGVFWRDFTAPGPLKPRAYAPDPAVRGDMGTLAARISVAPGETGTVRFLLSWYFPNNRNYWNPLPEEGDGACCGSGGCDCADGSGAEISGCGCAGGTGVADGNDEVPPGTWKNWYATAFADAAAVARYGMREWNRLYEQTRAFHDALFGSTLPAAVLEAVSANLSTLKSPTCLRLEDGSFYGWEGCGCVEGCCEGSCTHVWNYAQALPFLFPSLERSMRDLDFRYNMRDDGGMVFRLQLPLGRKRGVFRPCVDGQFGGVMKLYRDWKICGDTEWLRGHWEAVKKNIAFAWAPTNADGWDRDQDGVLEGRQHHTLDMELFGPNSWLTGMYLGALKAAAEMADTLGDAEAGALYRALFKRGKKWADKHLFNGKWYVQRIDLGDKSLLERYDSGVSLHGDKTLDAYWNAEAGEIKYQIGEGSAIDQVLGQWHANLYGLGEIYKPEQVRGALETIYTHNYKRSFRDFFNPCRLYSLQDEGGVVICDWPEGTRKPVVPAPYCEETMYGFEYQVASHMIQEGMVAQGLEIVEVIRSRFDGEKRNPWNEFECGNNYARSMASYALLNALSGFSFDMAAGRIGFKPASALCPPVTQEFRCFWSLDGGWGVFSQGLAEASLQLRQGRLVLRELQLDRKVFELAAGVLPVNQPGSAVPYPGVRSLVLECRMAGTGESRDVYANIRDGVVELEDGFVLEAGETLVIPLV